MKNMRNFVLFFIITTAQCLNAEKTLPEAGFFSRRHLATKFYFIATFNREAKIREAIEADDLEKFKQLFVKEDLLAIDNLLEDLIGENKVEFVDYIANEANVDIYEFVNFRKEKGLSKPFLIGLFAKYGSTALNMKDVLKEAGFNFNERDEKGNNALHIAVAQGDELLIEELSKEVTINKNEFNDEGQTPLDVAVVNDEPHLLYTLREVGVDFDRHDTFMRSVGQRALEAKCSPRTFAALVDNGIDVGSSESQAQSVAKIIRDDYFKNAVEMHLNNPNSNELIKRAIEAERYKKYQDILEKALAKRHADELNKKIRVGQEKINASFSKKMEDLEKTKKDIEQEEDRLGKEKHEQEKKLEEDKAIRAQILEELAQRGNNNKNGID